MKKLYKSQTQRERREIMRIVLSFKKPKNKKDKNRYFIYKHRIRFAINYVRVNNYEK